MTQSPTPPPNDSRQPDDRPRAVGPLRPLEFDEMVALFVAFLSLGGVLFWGLSRGEMNLFANSPLATGPLVTESDAGVAAGDDTAASVSGDDDRALAAPTAASTISREESALKQLADRAAARRERISTGRPIWEDVRDGMVGAAAGITGATATSEGAAAVEAETETPEVEAAATDAREVPDIGTAIPSEAARATPREAIIFDDVPAGYWAAPYIDALSSRGLISGYEDGTFNPDQPVTRAQIANIVSRTFDLTVDAESLEFSDVASDNWARESIGEVVQGGFMTGFPDDTFKPNEPVTRAQALTTLVTGLGIETPTNIQATLDRYTDANAIPNWANEKMAAATAGSLVVNHPEIAVLNPTKPTTRAELSAIIYQALVREGVVEAVDSAYVVKP